MADRTLLVPGTQATNLLDQDGDRVYNVVRVNLGLSKRDLGKDPTAWVPILSMEHAPGQLAPVRTSLRPRTQVRTGSVLRTPYEAFARSYKPWPYDWRCDLRHNAASLLELLERDKPSDGRWNLVGHSQGGLIIVAASKLLDDPARFESLVARVALLGAPLAGTMRAADALCFGSEDLGKEEQAFARALARTWPALYQMLPSWDAILDPTERPLPATEQLLELGGWPEAEGVTLDLLQRAKELQAMLRDPFARFGGTRARAIMTSNKPTKVTMVRLPTAGGDVFEGESYQGGDSLVPYEQTRSWGGTAFDQFVVHVPGNVRAHAFLGIDEEIAAFVARFFGQP
jgi:pimeloyl-ACP methyl ester carboxylesterase